MEGELSKLEIRLKIHHKHAEMAEEQGLYLTALKHQADVMRLNEKLIAHYRAKGVRHSEDFNKYVARIKVRKNLIQKRSFLEHKAWMLKCFDNNLDKPAFSYEKGKIQWLV